MQSKFCLSRAYETHSGSRYFFSILSKPIPHRDEIFICYEHMGRCLRLLRNMLLSQLGKMCAQIFSNYCFYTLKYLLEWCQPNLWIVVKGKHNQLR